ncbi:MAG: response regulator transcription factor [Lentilitoribacter sp.]
MQTNVIKMVIADDHDLVREGIHVRLASETYIDLIGEAKNGREAVDLCRALKPDLILLDISMPELNGLEAASIIKEELPDTKILFLSVYDNDEYVQESLRIGANGFVLKDVSKPEMLNAIRLASSGATYLGPRLSKSLAANAPIRAQTAQDYGLTNREKQVLAAISRGMPNKEIAETMNISVRTVESHRMSIREKTGGGNAVVLTKIASELGLT